MAKVWIRFKKQLIAIIIWCKKIVVIVRESPQNALSSDLGLLDIFSNFPQIWLTLEELQL